jgi:hypothetical protein
MSMEIIHYKRLLVRSLNEIMSYMSGVHNIGFRVAVVVERYYEIAWEGTVWNLAICLSSTMLIYSNREYTNCDNVSRQMHSNFCVRVIIYFILSSTSSDATGSSDRICILKNALRLEGTRSVLSCMC